MVVERSKTMAWDDFRKPWQDHIICLYKAIDLHSELATKGDEFHQRQYEILTNYVKDLKQWIVDEEKRQGINIQSNADQEQ